MFQEKNVRLEFENSNSDMQGIILLLIYRAIATLAL